MAVIGLYFCVSFDSPSRV